MIFSFARSKQIDCQLRGSKLIIDKKNYTYVDSKRLPHGLSIEAAKMIEVEDGLAFQSKHAPLSNIDPCEIKYKGKDYSSDEQGLQFEHAQTYKREDLAENILETDDPDKIMAIARALPESEEWSDKEEDICRELNKCKYEQNTHLKRRLLSTKGHLYEATKHRKFGCGFTLMENQQINKKNIRAGNKLGEILEFLRDHYFTDDKKE